MHVREAFQKLLNEALHAQSQKPHPDNVVEELIVIENTEATSLADKYAAGGMDKLAAELENDTYIKAASAHKGQGQG